MTYLKLHYPQLALAANAQLTAKVLELSDDETSLNPARAG